MPSTEPWEEAGEQIQWQSGALEGTPRDSWHCRTRHVPNTSGVLCGREGQSIPGVAQSVSHRAPGDDGPSCSWREPLSRHLGQFPARSPSLRQDFVPGVWTGMFSRPTCCQGFPFPLCGCTSPVPQKRRCQGSARFRLSLAGFAAQTLPRRMPEHSVPGLVQSSAQPGSARRCPFTCGTKRGV